MYLFRLVVLSFSIYTVSVYIYVLRFLGYINFIKHMYLFYSHFLFSHFDDQGELLGWLLSTRTADQVII